MTAKEIEEGHISSDRWPLVSHFTQKILAVVHHSGLKSKKNAILGKLDGLMSQRILKPTFR